MFKDTSYPIRILTALKLFVLGVVAHFGLLGLLKLGNRGEVGDPPADPDNPPPPPPAPPSTDWHESIPADVRSDPVFAKYKSQDDVYRALVGAQKFLGRETLPVPKDANDKEAVDLILKRLGLPEKEDGYILPTDLNIPPELPVEDTLIADFKKTAHGLGILPHQFQGLYKWYMTNMAEQFGKLNEEQIIATKEAETALRKKWGAAYQQNVGLAKKVYESFADEKARFEFEKGLGNNPVLVEFLANIGKVLSEDQLQGKPGGLTMTPDEAMSELKKMEADRESPLFDESHSQHAEYVEKRNRLYKLAYPGS